MRVAALDLGSNTSLLLIADVIDGRIERVVSDETHVTRMGQGVHAHRRFHAEALKRMESCLGDYAQKIQQAGCEKVVAVATSAARDVANGDELIALGRKHNIPIHIITGQREAELTFQGALCDRATADGTLVVDVGGGSTEIIGLRGGKPSGVSIDVGSVRLTELYIKEQPIPAMDLVALNNHIERAFRDATLSQIEAKEVVAVAGTPTTLAALEQKTEFSEQKVNGFHLSLSTIENWAAKMSKMTVEQRELLPGMQPKRADVIVTGSMILAGALRALKKNAVTVSTRGVRYGVALACADF